MPVEKLLDKETKMPLNVLDGRVFSDAGFRIALTEKLHEVIDFVNELEQNIINQGDAVEKRLTELQNGLHGTKVSLTNVKKKLKMGDE